MLEALDGRTQPLAAAPVNGLQIEDFLDLVERETDPLAAQNQFDTGTILGRVDPGSTAA